jgi:hypothetical protein
MKKLLNNNEIRENEKLSNYRSRPSQLALYLILEHHLKTFLDGAFQRYAGYEFASGWTLQQMKEYIVSLIQGEICNDIVRVDLQQAYLCAKEKGLKEDAEYFKKLLDAGFLYLSVDGNNTSSTVTHFILGEFAIKDEETGEDIFFEDLNREQKRNLENKTISVLTISDISKEQIHNLFVRLQNGEGLSPQELRNAICSDLSKFIREQSNTASIDKEDKKRSIGTIEDSSYPTGRPFFNNVVFPKKTEEHLEKRRHEQFSAMIINKIESQYTEGIGSRPLDKLYNDNLDLKDSTKKSFKNVMTTLDGLFSGGPINCPISKVLHGPNSIHTFIDLVHLLVNEKNFQVTDVNKLFEEFKKWEDRKVEESSKLTQSEEDRAKSYIWQQKYSTQPGSYTEVVKWLKEEIAENSECISDWEGKEIIKKKRTSKQNFSTKQAIEASEGQNWLTRKEQPFTLENLLKGELHKDHMKSVKDGGETKVENCELMYPEDNFKKGSKSNEPHFDYQK